MNRPHLLLLHGALGAGHQFDALAARLEGDFTVHAPDFEGHGAAAPADRPFRNRGFMDNVLKYLDERRIDRVDLFGYSMGGYVGLCLAHAYPERVARLFTLSTKLDWTPEFAAGELRMLDADAIERKVPAFAQALERRHTAYGWRNVLSATAEMMQALGERPDLDVERLAALEHRVRIGVGDRDHMVSLEECVRAYRAMPNAELQVIPATPHPIEKMDADRLAAAIRDFFGAAPGSATRRS